MTCEAPSISFGILAFFLNSLGLLARPRGGFRLFAGLAATVVVAGVLLPPVYLVVCRTQGGSDSVDVLVRARTGLLLDTAAV